MDQQQLRELIKTGLQETNNAAGGQVAYLADDEIMSAAGGIANMTGNLPVVDETLFQIGSTTKIYNAVLLMQLVEQGDVDLDTPVAEYLDIRISPDNRQNDITPRQLLSMSSGIDNGPYHDTGRNDDCVEKLLECLADIPMIHEPGKGYGYTNCSSDMAGRITEVIRGKSWDDVLLEQVIKPMSLTQTDSLYERLVCHPLAVGHTGTRDKPELLPFWGLYRGHAPAGSTVCASASDMVRFGSLFLNRVDGVLGADTIKLMMEKQVDTPTKFMAHGWCLGPYYKVWDGVEIWGHSGTNLGGSSTLLWIPEKDAAVAVTSNHATQGYPLAAFCFREILGEFGIEMPAKFEPVASDENISKHVGQYQAHQVTIDITQGDDETLHAKKTTRQFNETVIESDLKPLGNGRFLVLDPVFSGNRDWDVAFWDDCLTDGVFTLKKA